MRYGILGDIHGNLEALETIVRHLKKEGVDRYLSVGDIVGYGADPGPCIQVLRDLSAAAVAGNHDWAVIGRLDASFFNIYAREAVEWTQSALSAEDRAFLEGLPLIQKIDDRVTLVHATLHDPELFDYIQTYSDAQKSLAAMTTPLCFIGHSHVPMAFLSAETIVLQVAPHIDLAGATKALINVGSIGQPRDENPKAAYAIYDSAKGTYALKRVRYDVMGTAAKIRRAGLPPILAERLRFGR